MKYLEVQMSYNHLVVMYSKFREAINFLSCLEFKPQMAWWLTSNL